MARVPPRLPLTSVSARAAGLRAALVSHWASPSRGAGAVVFRDTTVPRRGMVRTEVSLMIPATCPPDPAVLQAGFQSVLPRIRLHAQIYFRHVRCPHAR